MTPEEVVRAAVAAWGTLDANEIVSWFTDDAVWDNMPLGAVSGKDELRKAVVGWLSKTQSSDMEITNLAVNGNLVLVERVDHIGYGGGKIDAPAMATFEVRGDKVAVWRDYFDTGDRRGKAPLYPGAPA